MVRRLACILLLELRKEFKVPSDGETATLLYSAGFSSDDVDKLEEKVQEMVAVGSRYKNLEKEIGLGVAFVLGTSIPESSYAVTSPPRSDYAETPRWKKLLPKSGPKFTEFIDHANKTSLPALAAQYSNLRTAVIETQLCVYRRSQSSLETALGSPSFGTSEMF